MRHGKKLAKMGVKAKHRKALLRNLALSLIHHERIQTTLPKAKGMRPFVEKLITLGKKGTNHHKRMARKHMYEDSEALQKLFTVLGPRYADRQGGYTRILKIGHRQGDTADMALIELVDRVGEVRKARPAKGASEASPVEITEEDLRMGRFYPQVLSTSMGLGQGGQVTPIDEEQRSGGEEEGGNTETETNSEGDGEGIETGDKNQ